jgi:hypothetical protein
MADKCNKYQPIGNIRSTELLNFMVSSGRHPETFVKFMRALEGIHLVTKMKLKMTGFLKSNKTKF